MNPADARKMANLDRWVSLAADVRKLRYSGKLELDCLDGGLMAASIVTTTRQPMEVRTSPR